MIGKLLSDLQLRLTSTPSMLDAYSRVVGRRTMGARSLSQTAASAAFLLDGFPRSGNTYMTNLVREVFGAPPFLHHFHNIAALKSARERGVPSFILYRDPLESIASLMLFHAGQSAKFTWPIRTFVTRESLMANVYLRRYVAYYDYVLGASRATIFPSRTAFEAPETIVAAISEAAELPGAEIDYARFKHDYFERKRRQASGREATAGIPNDAKRREKQRLVAVIERDPYYAKAQEMYRRLRTVTEPQRSRIEDP